MSLEEVIKIKEEISLKTKDMTFEELDAYLDKSMEEYRRFMAERRAKRNAENNQPQAVSS